MASSSCDLFQICHCNIHSPLGKVSELGVMVVQQNLDIICVTKSWLDNSISDGMVQLDGYLPPFRKDRDVRYGGVAVFQITYQFQECLNWNSMISNVSGY